MNLSRIRLVTFDVTGTLLKFRTAVSQQYGEIGAMYGVVVDNDLLVRNLEEQMIKMRTEHPNFGLNSGFGWEKWWKMLVKEVFNSPQFRFEDEKLDKVGDHLVDIYQTSVCWQQAYGVPELLSYIKSKNIPMGVISNYDPSLELVLTNNELRHYFRFIIASYEAGMEKPDQRIFDLALEKSQQPNIKPEECLHIGDNLHLDYQAAKSCGWNAILVNEPDFKSLKEDSRDLEPSELFDSMYQLHISLLKETDDKLPITEPESNSSSN